VTVSTFPKEARVPKILFIADYAKELEVNVLDCVAYLDICWRRVIDVLKQLPDLQKEFLLQLVLHYTNCNGTPTETEFLIISKYLKRVNFTENICVQKMYKNQAIDNLLQN
jgi:hypothetical protein